MQLMLEYQSRPQCPNFDQRTVHLSQLLRTPAHRGRVSKEQSHRNAPVMVLCPACQAVPYRSMFRLMEGDETTRDDFEWLFPPNSVSREEKLKRVYFRWHNSISELRSSARFCPFCALLHGGMEDMWRFKANVVDSDTRSLWLETPHLNGDPLLFVWIGDAGPEAIISGNYRFYTTLGKLNPSSIK
jgi:hypothetical protein